MNRNEGWNPSWGGPESKIKEWSLDDFPKVAKRQGWGPELTEVMWQRWVELKRIEELTPTGEYYIRHRKIDDHNSFWKAGWPVPEYNRQLWNEQGNGKWWVIVDRGDESICFGSFYEEEIRAILAVNQANPNKEVFIAHLPEGFPTPDKNGYKERRRHHKNH